jgi:hypothetical protein
MRLAQSVNYDHRLLSRVLHAAEAPSRPCRCRQQGRSIKDGLTPMCTLFLVPVHKYLLSHVILEPVICSHRVLWPDGAFQQRRHSLRGYERRS